SSNCLQRGARCSMLDTRCSIGRSFSSNCLQRGARCSMLDARCSIGRSFSSNCLQRGIVALAPSISKSHIITTHNKRA
ncbi:MAG: hypothetical protein AB1797_08730, partial [bacterium]